MVFEGFQCSKGDKTQSGLEWRCSVHLFTDDSGGILLTTVSVHSHEQCPDLSRQYIPNSAKLKVKLELKEKNLPLP